MTVEVKTPPAMARWRDVMRPEFTRRLYRTIADRVENLVRHHILRIAPAHHIWANRLGAQPTGHLTKGARLTHSTSGSDYAEIIIPIPGMSRAFKPLAITPQKAPSLTIPIAAASYGQRVSRMRQLGWVLFRPKGRDVLMGTPQGGGETVPLYLLKKRVEQRQDRSLLPSDAAIGLAASAAVSLTLQRSNI